MTINYFSVAVDYRVEFHYSWRQDNKFHQIVSNEKPEQFANNQFLVHTDKVWIDMKRVNENGQAVASFEYYNKG